jgi:hypothetical protein
VQKAAHALGRKIVVQNASSDYDIDAAFASFGESERVDLLSDEILSLSETHVRIYR